MNKQNPYDPLVLALAEPLPEQINEREKVREMVAFAESYGIIVSQERRKLLSVVEGAKADAIKRLKQGIFYDDEGELQHDEEAAADFKSLTADQKNIMLDAEVSNLTANLEFVTHLEDLIKRRCSVGQSILNSFNVEVQSSFNK